MLYLDVLCAESLETAQLVGLVRFESLDYEARILFAVTFQRDDVSHVAGLERILLGPATAEARGR